MVMKNKKGGFANEKPNYNVNVNYNYNVNVNYIYIFKYNNNIYTYYTRISNLKSIVIVTRLGLSNYKPSIYLVTTLG